MRSIWVPDASGRSVNVALGFRSLDAYVENFRGGSAGGSGATFFGAIVGRFANRIAPGGFVVDGSPVSLSADEVMLHGGADAYHTQVWDAKPVRVGSGVGLRLAYVDPAGKNGFPGTVRNEVTYAVSEDNALRIEYRATTDAPTVINLTNHTYFNLAGEGSGDVFDQLVAVNADRMLAVDEAAIPVGFMSAAGTAFDFRSMKAIGRDIRDEDSQLRFAGGYDHNFVLRGAGYRLAAVAHDPGTGIVLWTYTDRPGVQFYSANHLAGDVVGPSGQSYGPGAGFALETQAYPDSPHHIGEPGWPSVVLRPGAVFSTRTTYRFAVAGPGLAARVRF